MSDAFSAHPNFSRRLGSIAVLLSLAAATCAGAANFTNLYSFGAAPGDGESPQGGLALVGTNLYGAAFSGGSSANGTVFALSLNGASQTNLYNFSASSSLTNSDGANPEALLISSGILFGTTYNGGAWGSGAVFRIGTNGAGFTNLYSFTRTINSTNKDGQGPQAALIIAGNTLYGATGGGGLGGNGTLFRINLDGTGFTNLHSFSPLTPQGTNADGANPSAALVLAGGILYGTAYAGGSGGNGTVYAISTNATGFTNLYSFSPLSSDGANPQSALVLVGANLFGTTVNGGKSANGTVFRLGTNGTAFTNLYSFSPVNSADTNADGTNPSAGLLLAGGALYGTALRGGNGANGTIFKLNTDGAGFVTLYSFSALGNGASTNSDGANPGSSLVLSNDTFYGTANNGGLYGQGTVFSLRVVNPIPLNFQTLNHSLILSWADPAFSLQSATKVSGSFSDVPGATSPYTNATTIGQKYFRLKGN